MKKLALILLLTSAILAIAVGATYAARRDQMDARRQAVTAAWSQVEAVLQRRAQLVDPVVAMHPRSAQEREAFAELAQAQKAVRSAGSPADVIAANQQLDQSVRRLFALVDSDPDLRFNDKVFRVEEQLNVAQNRVAAARGRYDQALQDYNALLSDFPNELFARWSGHAPLINYFADSAAPPNTGATSPGE